MREKRQHLRAEYRVPVRVSAEERTLDCECRDVSLGGVFLLSAEQLPLGAMVVLAFELPALGPVELPGFVRWTNAEGFGVQFGLIGARETHAIGRIVRGSNPG